MKPKLKNISVVKGSDGSVSIRLVWSNDRAQQACVGDYPEAQEVIWMIERLAHLLRLDHAENLI